MGLPYMYVHGLKKRNPYEKALRFTSGTASASIHGRPHPRHNFQL